MAKNTVKRKVSVKAKTVSKAKPKASAKSHTKTKKVVARQSHVGKTKKEVLPPTANNVIFQLWKAKQNKDVKEKTALPMPAQEKSTFHGGQTAVNQNYARFNGPRRKAS